MNRKGFTLVELLAVLVILAIVMGITIVSVGIGTDKAKRNSEVAFIDTIEDALDIYLDTISAKKLKFSVMKIRNEAGLEKDACIKKTHGNVRLYLGKKNNNGEVTFSDVINSEYNPLVESDLFNPATDKQCGISGKVEIYRDDNSIYYYKIAKSDFDNCFVDNTGVITNLPVENIVVCD